MTITNTDDLIQISDIEARIEELQDIETPDEYEDEEFTDLENLLDQCNYQGYELINEDYFQTYIQGLLEIDVPGYVVIDWEATAENVKNDYTVVDFDGTTYYMSA